MHGFPVDIAEQPARNRAVLPGRCQCHRQYRRDLRPGILHILYDKPVWNEALFQGYLLAGCAADVEVSFPASPDYRSVQYVDEAADADDKAFCQYACRSYRVCQIQCCPFRKYDGRVGALRSVHGPARSACGFPPGVCVHDSVSSVHRYGKTERSLMIIY